MGFTCLTLLTTTTGGLDEKVIGSGSAVMKSRARGLGFVTGRRLLVLYTALVAIWQIRE